MICAMRAPVASGLICGKAPHGERWLSSRIWRRAMIFSRQQIDLFQYVYLMEAGSHLKIGASQDPQKRAQAVQTGCPH
jgi:hypothetical protein